MVAAVVTETISAPPPKARSESFATRLVLIAVALLFLLLFLVLPLVAVFIEALRAGLGAYVAAWATGVLGLFLPALALAMLVTAVIGVVVERTALRQLYARDHLYQVLATFGLILFFNELGISPLPPAMLDWSYPAIQPLGRFLLGLWLWRTATSYIH